jgi:hypothetical protein
LLRVTHFSSASLAARSIAAGCPLDAREGAAKLG